MIEQRGRIALFFPGIPGELIPMLRSKGIPAILERFGSPDLVFRTRTLHVYQEFQSPNSGKSSLTSPEMKRTITWPFCQSFPSSGSGWTPVPEPRRRLTKCLMQSNGL